MKEVLAAIERIFSLVTSTSGSTFFSAVGLILFLLAILSFLKIMESKPVELSSWFKIFASFCLVFAVLFSAIGPIFALVDLSDRPIKRIPMEESIDKLKVNSKIHWLIRLIPYTPGVQDHLSVSKLQKLGPDELSYTFVGPYEELKGYKVTDALTKVGASYEPGQRVSAIIFSVSTNYPIVPANARGLLQVVKNIEDKGEDLSIIS